MSYSKDYLQKFKGKKVTFRRVTSFPDLKIQFVDSVADYEYKEASNNSFSAEIVKVQEVSSFPDVKLKKVTAFGDFEIYFE